MKFKRVFAFSLISLIALSIISLGFTLSFYTSGQDLGFTDLNVSLASDPKLEIGIKNESEKIIYYENEVPSSALSNYIVNEFTPVSSMYSNLFLENKSEFPVFRDRYEGVTNLDPSSYKESKVASSGYFSIELYLRSDYDIYVTLSEESYIKEDEETNESKAKNLLYRYSGYTESEIFNNLNNIKKSMRIGLYDSLNAKNTIIDPFKDSLTPLFGILDVDNDRYYDSFIDKNDFKVKELLYGEYENEENIVYSYNSSEIRIPVNELNAFSAFHKEDSYIVDLEASLNNGLIGKYEDSVSLNEVSDDQTFILLNHDEPKRIVLSLYIEGWDKDNIGLVEYGAFMSYIKFKVTKEYIV